MGERGELLLGIDIGTSSSKGVLVRPDGEIVASATRPHQLSLPRPGWAEHDAETVWWADFTGLARELTATAAAHGTIAGVAVSGIGPCLLPVDEAGVPLRPAILYGIDTRATREIDELTERFGVQWRPVRNGISEIDGAPAANTPITIGGVGLSSPTGTGRAIEVGFFNLNNISLSYPTILSCYQQKDD